MSGRCSVFIYSCVRFSMSPFLEGRLENESYEKKLNREGRTFSVIVKYCMLRILGWNGFSGFEVSCVCVSVGTNEDSRYVFVNRHKMA